jgi:single-stranded-DNA-specific exonuclease
MEKAADRIRAAIAAGERIAVWHDYDCDGIPGGALLFDFFSEAGVEPLMYVPERSEGYGLNEAGVRALAKEGAKVVITVDCGITDVDEAKLAKELGLDLIVTDHHLPGPELPDAFAVVNPHRADDAYPFKGLCGTGVAFKLVEALLAKGDIPFTAGREKWLLDLVALATVADMVPLLDENRALVHWGLEVMRKGRRPGLRALFEREKIPLAHVTEDDLAFSIAPKVNAASRMASPKLAFELLSTRSPERARELAKELENLNKKRKLEGMRVAKDVKHKVEGMPTLGEVIVAGSRSWRPSLLGIAATSVVETYGRSAFLWGEDGGLIKGSCRSNGRVNIVELMRAVEDVFLDFGGHELAGGFSLAPEAVHLFPQRVEEAFASLAAGAAPAAKESLPDGILSLSEVTDSSFEALRQLAPFGQENEKPVFRFPNVAVERVMYFGGGKDHARIALTDTHGSAEAIAFFFGRSPFKDTLEFLSPGDRVTLDASIERSHFRGRKELRLRVIHLAFA